MDSATSQKSIIALENWLQTAPGAYVRAWEQAQLDELVADIFGFNAVQVGLPQLDALRANRMPNKWQAATHSMPPDPAGAPDVTPQDGRSLQVAAVLDFEELPFASQSLDLVVLPHVLEYAAEPHQVLREVERVLIPEGQLVICGFNPASLWGMRQVAGRATRSPYLPASAEFISMPRMKDWLKLLNLGVTRASYGCYAPAFRSELWLDRARFMESAGQRWWPYFGAVYIVHAIKRVKGMNIIGPAWTRRKSQSTKVVPVTNRKQP